MGVDKEISKVTSEDSGEFYQSLKLMMKRDGLGWELINIYGLAHDDRKRDFLEELLNKVQNTEHPMLLGGDFNLVRRIDEKSSGNVDIHLMDAFNNVINCTTLRELNRFGSRYTRSNKQNPPILCVLDRVLCSTSWEDSFNSASVFTALGLGSDHNPLVLDTDEVLGHSQHYFRFSSHWLNQSGFKDWVISKWTSRFKH